MDTTTLVSLLLDESGSMQSIKDDTIGGFNQYLASLKDPSAGAVLFSLVKFDSNAITKVYTGVPVADVQSLTQATYQPRASTPLIDAAYKIIVATAELVAARQDTPHVLVVIQTDGHENASTEHTNADLHQLIKEKTEAGWSFVFLGAGIDAFAQARQWGIQGASTLSYSREKSAETFGALSSNTARYRMSGQVADVAFTAQQRTAAGEIATPPAAAQPVPATPQSTAPSSRPAVAPRKPIVDDFSLVPEEGA